MRRAIRNFRNGMFFSHGDWISESWLAEEFPDEQTIAEMVAKYQIPNAEMVFLVGARKRVGAGVRISCPPRAGFALLDHKSVKRC